MQKKVIDYTEAGIAWIKMAKLRYEMCKEQGDIKGMVHWKDEVNTVTDKVLRYDGCSDDIAIARRLNFEIEYAMGQIFYIQPKEEVYK